MTTREEGRLSRWSRLKQEDRERLAEGSVDAPSAVEVPVERDDDAVAEGTIDPEDLPDIDGLDGESDFTPFLQQGVPEHLHRLALRKLWTSDPVLANLDGLIDYDPDNMPFLKTVEQVAEKLLRERLRASGGDSKGNALEAVDGEPVSEADGVADEQAGAAAEAGEATPPGGERT